MNMCNSTVRSGIFFAILIVIVLNSCNQDDIVRKNNFPLKAGNYWVYRIKIAQADGRTGFFGGLDSVWIEKDTLINSKTYWKQNSTLDGVSYLRDSADMVTLRKLTYEQIIYSSNPNLKIKYDNGGGYKIITNYKELTGVPAGKFRTNNCRTILPKSGDHAHGPEYDHDFYTVEQFLCDPDVGLIKYAYENFYLDATVEHELVRYKLRQLYFEGK